MIFLILAIAIFSILSIHPIDAASNTSKFSKSMALDYLDNKTTGFPDNAETSLSFLALSTNNIDVTDRLQSFLQQNPDRNCYSIGNCRIKDTSFALLALNTLGESTENALKWLESKERVAKTQGDWLIQIFSTGSGRCSIMHEDERKFVDVNGTTHQLIFDKKIINFINIKQDLNTQINNPLEEFEVDCTNIGGSTIISLLRQTGDEYRIIQQEDTNKATLKLKDICYGESSCNKDDTFIASLILNIIDKDKELPTFQYLKDNAISNLDYSILYEITNDERYSDLLFQNQAPSKSWDNDIFTTSIALFSFRNLQDNRVQEALTWLKSKQKNDGSIGNQFETASSIYFALTADVSQISPPGAGGGAGGYCGDNIVQKESGEECDSESDTIKEGAVKDCSNSCTSTCECAQVECRVDEDCLPGKQCNTKTFTCFSSEQTFQCSSDDDCPSSYMCDVVSRACKPLPKEDEKCSSDIDCKTGEACNKITEKCIAKEEDECGNNICSNQESESNCPEDCSQQVEKKKSSFWWVWLIVFLLGLGILIFIIYRKSTKQEEEQPYFETGEKPRKKHHPKPGQQGQEGPDYEQYYPQEGLEQQIDKSIKEAQELLKKK